MTQFTYSGQESQVRSIVDITFDGPDDSENVFNIEQLETIIQEAKTRQANWLKYKAEFE